ncbi:MAG: hypothetical protein R3C56_19155 [Pirellulaceae bacterium]
MTDYGFYIDRVWLTGSDVAEAAVEFQDGLNVVSGPSNTGKTYIARALTTPLVARMSQKKFLRRAVTTNFMFEYNRGRGPNR